MQLQSGQQAANGFWTLSSNKLTVNIDKQPPQVGAAVLHLNVLLALLQYV